jgi:hypothetical protein
MLATRSWTGRFGSGSARVGVAGHTPGDGGGSVGAVTGGAVVVVLVGGAVVGAAGAVVVVGAASGAVGSGPLPQAATKAAATTTAATRLTAPSSQPPRCAPPRVVRVRAVRRTPTCVWRISEELVVALDTGFGEPDDAYVNGSQVWLREDGPDDMTFEWRLHPVPGYRKPDGVATEEVFPAVALALETGATLPAPPEKLWEGLEAFPIDADAELEPAVLSAACTEALGIAPDGSGLVDHDAIGDAWEKAEGEHSIIESLFEQLGT